MRIILIGLFLSLVIAFPAQAEEAEKAPQVLRGFLYFCGVLIFSPSIYFGKSSTIREIFRDNGLIQ